jgi:hypothetical protein
MPIEPERHTLALGDLPLTAGHVLAQRMWIEAFEEYYQ